MWAVAAALEHLHRSLRQLPAHRVQLARLSAGIDAAVNEKSRDSELRQPAAIEVWGPIASGDVQPGLSFIANQLAPIFFAVFALQRLTYPLAQGLGFRQHGLKETSRAG